MKTLSIFIVLISLGLIYGSVVDPKWRKESISIEKSKTNNDLKMKSDWLIDWIEKILGMVAEDFLKLIDFTVRQLSLFVVEVLSQLEQIISKIPNADIRAQLKAINTNFLQEWIEIMKPIQEHLDIIIPELQTIQIQIIGDEKNTNPRMNLADLISALLGISLEELLVEINLALIKTESLVEKSLQQLLEIDVDGSAGQELEEVINGSLLEANKLITPILKMLDNVLPNKPKIN